jgi:hypothetical protein
MRSEGNAGTGVLKRSPIFNPRSGGNADQREHLDSERIQNATNLLVKARASPVRDAPGADPPRYGFIPGTVSGRLKQKKAVETADGRR